MSNFFTKMLDSVRDKSMKEEIIKHRRRTGKSTGAALSVIGKCLLNPGIDFIIVDFEPYAKLPRRRSVINIVIPILKDTITRLGLEGFSINTTNLTIKYEYFK